MKKREKPSNSNDQYFDKELKLFKHPRMEGLVLGLPAVNKPVIQDLYTLKLSAVSGVPGTVGELADLELFHNKNVRKVTGKIEEHNLVDLNWPNWEDNF